MRQPFFSGAAAFELSLDRTEAGRLRGYRIAPVEQGKGKKEASKGADGASSETVTLAADSGGTPVSARRKTADSTVFSRFSAAGGEVEELSFDEKELLSGRTVCRYSGALLTLVSAFAEDGGVSSSVRYDYDSLDRVVRVEAAEYSAETVYGADGNPRFVRAASGAEAKQIERRFQWDERGLLVREFSRDADGKPTETAYSYVFDAAGQWIERRAVNYAERFGVRGPEKGARVLRKISYR
jgi:hypothetical protein